VNVFFSRMQHYPVSVDQALLDRTSNLLVTLMAPHVETLLERDGLPHLCHIINGWGNATFHGRRMTEYMTMFLQHGTLGESFILQCDPEGDFHPWQSLAYGVMAGIDPDEPLAVGTTTLRNLAKTSRFLNTNDGHELGHLLFALAFLDPTLKGKSFDLAGNICSGQDLLTKAIDAHHFGSFEVCRKIHLTEGIASISAQVPAFSKHRTTAQGFITGQLDILFVLGTILSEVKSTIQARKLHRSNSLLSSLRESLIIGDFFENHVYYAGHLIELAGFAIAQGYTVTEAHQSAIAFTINEINSVLPLLAPRLSFEDCFLHFGHYRRAITLIRELQINEEQRKKFNLNNLRRYEANFDSPESDSRFLRQVEKSNPPEIDLGLYKLDRSIRQPRPRFLEVVSIYNEMVDVPFKLRGGFDHFRRIIPKHWPRAAHYELLDYGDCLGVEIHLESDCVLPLRIAIQNFTPEISKRLHPIKTSWDSDWYKCRGRLRSIFPDSISSESVAGGLLLLLETTFPTLNSLAKTLSVSSLRASNKHKHIITSNLTKPY